MSDNTVSPDTSHDIVPHGASHDEEVYSQEPSSHHVAKPERYGECPPLEELHEGAPPGKERIGIFPPARKPKVAVFVAHGIGQQIRFETLDKAAQNLLDASGAQSKPEMNVRTIQVGTQFIRRVEFDMRDASGQEVEVHAYEGYWAPLTEGQVALKDVLWFLYYAGVRNFSKHGARLARWMFDRTVVFDIPVTTRHHLLLTFIVFVSLLIIGTLVSFVTGSYLLLPTGTTRWPSLELLQQLTRVAGIYSVFSALFGAALFLLWRFKPKPEARLGNLWNGLNMLVWWMFFLFLIVTIITAVWLAWLVLSDVVVPKSTVRVADLTAWGNVRLIGTWVLLAIVFWQIRLYAMQYLGDVTVYVASHRLDRFFDIRARIKGWIHNALYAVYSQCDEEGNHIYERVGLIGHSLGSVILYDALNALLNEDDLHEPKMNVATRTKVLVTFGSPLDKIAYAFRLQGADARTSETREALAASVQPLIVDYERYRKMKWINVYTDRDIIGGALDFFDLNFDKDEDPEARKTLEPYKNKRVKNVRDGKARIPLLAHQELWETGTTFEEFYRAF